MIQQVFQNLKCSKEGHQDEIDSVCYKQSCTEFRLNCFQCIKKGSHHTHLADIEKTHTVIKYIENQNMECNDLIDQLNKLQESVSQSFSQYKKGINQKYSISKERLIQLNSQQINDFLNSTIQFTEYKKSITTAISDQMKKLTHTFNHLYNQLKIQSFNYYLISDNDTQQSQQMYNQGYQLYDVDKYEESIKLLDKAIQLNPKKQDALWCKGDQNNQLLLGECLRMLDRYEDAIPWYDKALSIDPKNVNSLSGKGECLRMLNKYADAIPWYDKTLSIDPQHVNSLSGKGECLRMLDKDEDAIPWYDKALSIDPKHVNSLSGKGECLRLLKRYNDSLKYIDQALSVDPNHIYSLQSKGQWLENQRKYEGALILYQQILKINPNDQWTIKQKTFCEGKLKK